MNVLPKGKHDVALWPFTVSMTQAHIGIQWIDARTLIAKD
jgi:hypothetical protein